MPMFLQVALGAIGFVVGMVLFIMLLSTVIGVLTGIYRICTGRSWRTY